jgi:hypothetical protein
MVTEMPSHPILIQVDTLRPSLVGISKQVLIAFDRI